MSEAERHSVLAAMGRGALREIGMRWTVDLHYL